MRKSQTRAAIYARKSTEDAKRPGKSVADQIAEAREEVTMRGWLMDESHVFADDGISASRHAKGKARPGYDALVRAVEAHQVDALVMAELSRLSRKNSQLWSLIELCQEHDVRLVIGRRDVDPSDPAEQVLLGVQASMDSAESDRARTRILRGMRNAAKAGRPSGKNQFGYTRTYDALTGELESVDVEPEESAVVREIVERILAGDPLNVIAADLNDREIPSPYDSVAMRMGREPKGAYWVGTQVRRIAMSPLYAGIRVHLGDHHEGIWPAIVTKTEHKRVTSILDDPRRRTNAGVRPGAVVHWLSGIAKCGNCGHGLRVLTNRGTYRAYLCPQCFGVTRAATALEEFVQAHIFEIVTKPKTLAAIAAASETGGDASQAYAELQSLNLRRDQVRALIVQGTMPPQDGAAVLASLGAEIEAAERRVRESSVPRSIAEVVSPDIEERWASFSPARKREIAEALVDVTVLSLNGRKTRKFLPEFVSVRPKGSAA